VNVLLDGCVWGGARAALGAAGHEVESTADWLRDPGDSDVLAHAHRNGQVFSTLDKDWWLRTFLGKPAIDTANWRAEHATHPAVLTRKACGGNRTARGAETRSSPPSSARIDQRDLDRTDVLTPPLHARQLIVAPGLVRTLS
jgi:hypothetical protein